MDSVEQDISEPSAPAPVRSPVDPDRVIVGPRRATPRAAVVRRTKLVERLCDVDGGMSVAVVAPAGYGKSTLLARWAIHDQRPAAWVTINRYDNDPATLLARTSGSLSDAGLLRSDSSPAPRVTSDTALSQGVRALVGAIDESTPGILILDQVESLRSRKSRDVVAEMAARVPASITLAVGSRSDFALPMSTLRSRGELFEVSRGDLAMSSEDARVMAAHIGIDTSDSTIDALVERTEGWPVGLYLAMLATKAGEPAPSLPGVRGDDRFLADYMRSELLRRISRNRADTLMRSSILDELSGPLCDFVLEQTNSSRTLDALASANLLVIPLDHRRSHYRLHQLFRDFLLSELQRRTPEEVGPLHLRAATWYEDQNMPDQAIHHAMVAGDVDRVFRLVGVSARVMFEEGRDDTVREWFTWLEETGQCDRYPDVCGMALITYAQLGDEVSVRRYTAILGASLDGDQAAVHPVISLTNAVTSRFGIEQMHTDAVATQASATAASEWYASAAGLEGIALLWSGETDEAERRLAHAAEVGERTAAFTAVSHSLAVRSLIANNRGDHGEADTFADRSLKAVHSYGLEAYATSVLSFVVAARAARRRGDPAEARRLLNQAVGRRTTMTAAFPVVSVHTLLEMVETHIELGLVATARQLLRDAGDILSQQPRLGRLEDWFAETRERLSTMHLGATASTLTNAELRLLPFLATHLSFAEIGERLYISRHTVKTQAMSIYRKLGVSSRSEAVTAARDTRLLDG